MLANLFVEQSLMKASSYAKKGEVDEAKKLYQTILRKFSNNIKAQQGLAALNKYKQSNSTQSPPQEAIDELVNLFNQGQILAVIGQAEVLTEQYPDSAVVWNILGASRAQIGNLDEAIEAYKKTISLKPDYADAYSNMGVALRNQGKFDEAIEVYKKSILLKPNDADTYYNMGIALKDQDKLDEAVEAYKKSISLKPHNAKAYNNLGTTFKEQGKLDEAVEAYKKVVWLKPKNATTYNNIGVIFKDQGKLDEAIEVYKKSISLKPDFAEAYDNMGVALKNQGKLDKAIEVFNKALSIKPFHSSAYFNMANTLRDQGKLEEAIIAYHKALSLKPNYADAYNSLGVTFYELGRSDEAEESYTQAIKLNPNFTEAIWNLSINRSYMNNLEAEICAWKNVLQIDDNNYGLRAGVNLAIHKFLEGDFKESKRQVLVANKIQKKMLPKFKSEKVYQSYLLKILKWHEHKYIDVNKGKGDKTLYVIGESHSLTSHHLRIQLSGVNFFCKANLIRGCKQWHLGSLFRNQYKNKFESIFLSIPRHSDVLLAIGEIDCRLDSGIIDHKNKFPEKNIKEIILATVENYLTYIVNNNAYCQHNIVIQGVPCPNINIEKHAEKDVIQLIEVINIFNYELEAKSKEKGFNFLDVHKLTDNGNGLSNKFWHIDPIHLSPDGMIEAWQRYNC